MTNDLTMDFARRLKRHRLRLDYSQTQLAELAGMTQAQVSYLESGDRNPSLVTVRRLADALEVGVAELMGEQ